MIANATIAAAPAVAPSFRKICRPADAAPALIPALDESARLDVSEANPASSVDASNAGMLGADMSMSDVIG